jgi:hypothetical protein
MTLAHVEVAKNSNNVTVNSVPLQKLRLFFVCLQIDVKQKTID